MSRAEEQQHLINHESEFGSTEEQSTTNGGCTIGHQGSIGCKSSHCVLSIDSEIQSYKRRWWILFVYSLMGFSKGLVWNTWAPISASVIIAFNWTDNVIAQLPNMTVIVCLIVALPVMYAVQAKGLRFAAVFAVSWLAIGCILLLIGAHTKYHWLIYVSSGCTGLASAVALTCGSLFSVTWFPLSERNTATSIATMSTYYGIGLAFFIHPHLVGVTVTSQDVENKNNLTAEFKEQVENGIFRSVYFDTAVVALAFLLTVIYFPSKPPKPPNISQTTEQLDFWQGMKLIFQKPQFWLLNLAYNITAGTGISWLALASMNYRPLGVGQVPAGWIGFAGQISAAIGSVIFSRIGDRYRRKTKTIAKIGVASSTIMLLILACIQQGYIMLPPHILLGCIFALSTVACISILGLMPIYYELGCEMTYPANEGLVGTVLTMVNFVMESLYYLLMLIPALAEDTHWMTWTMCGCTIVTLILLFSIKDDYPRLDLEEKKLDK